MSTEEVESRAAAVFLDAIGREGVDRAAFIEGACRGQPALRSRVLELLAADTAAEGFLEPRTAHDPTADDSAMIGRSVGRYTIKRLIGRGGMGAVYEAAQTDPERSVALKVMSPWLVSRESLRRFAHESRVLARLRHPGIGQVYETGRWRSDEDAREVPYFAMEFVPGARTLLRYAAVEHLDRPRALDLFAQVCDAVAHGHAHAVIHRDLKPANILVDEAGRPKVIDFGVARAADEHAPATLHTGAGQMIGTPTYMSPEQAAGDPDAVDARSDVYSLGVILFELLTGRPPLDLSTTTLARIAVVIRDTPPARPSALDRTLRGDLETILLKTLEKEPSRRYQSIADLGRDLRRFLARQPIEARPPTRAYLASMFVRRHRAGVAAAAFAALALIAGTGVASWQAVAANRARVAAESEADNVRRMNGFYLHMLAGINPWAGDTTVPVALPDATATDLFRRGIPHIPEAFRGKPELEVEVRSMIGGALMALDARDEAVIQLRTAAETAERTFGTDDRRTIEALYWFGARASGAGVVFEGELLESIDSAGILQDAVERARRVLGERDPLTIRATTRLAETRGGPRDAEFVIALLEPLMRAGIDEPIPRLSAMLSLTQAYRILRRFDRCEAWLDRAREQANVRGTPRELSATDRAALRLYVARREYARAEAVAWRIVEHNATTVGPSHAWTIENRQALGFALASNGKAAEAAAVTTHALARLEGDPAALPKDVCFARATAAWMAALAGEPDRAEALALQSIEGYRALRIDPDSLHMLNPVGALAHAWLVQGRAAQAETMMSENLPRIEAMLPDLDRLNPEHRLLCGLVGRCALNAGRLAMAETLLLDAYEEAVAVAGDGSDTAKAAAVDLVRLYESWSKPDRANEWRTRGAR